MKTFRGGLGYVLKEMLCTPVNGICKKCEEGTCIYSHFFEEKQGVHKDTYIGHVRPFILKNRYSRKTTYEKGESFFFSVHLFGAYIEYYHYFIAAFQRLGEKGIGKQKTKYDLVQVTSTHPLQIERMLYEENKDTLIQKPFIHSGSDVEGLFQGVQVNEIELNFITPFTILIQKNPVEQYDFPLLIENLIRKLQSLLYFHHNKECVEVEQCAELLEQAIDIDVSYMKLEKIKENRYSTRQQQNMNLIGVKGKIRFIGNISLFLPLLYIGQFTHLGKHTTFGMGQYKLKIIQ
ncbi:MULTISPECIES: CRISPR system precrRNA processing endoribonuclease RAMP protein Cas6 [Bacillus cereus group]|uniref:CRISPR system precrRNA processing endoribonuclease RAMP protein Cas6 n=1 Tax=Bacillus cereus group TaxID=86661 RepID=UPI001F405BE1|nr:CRISPR system precrRNA processing endoribonuclease RAMP protein Cas6 [Bacillus cereus]MDA1521471.1 CRISPR system precrRNA processing endoribonuclease RAMP protein Cas6 [Bacillus cereus]HDR7980989.1 CRISPR system precrRNA processing endoribonuclease RAMP protein Cas6 [Bacillus cereus]HDR8059557.1 CRISPR system precrRNA processing endoribonuclease RAMP protein Cas6 [Bacillus cereus]HDR8219295.1 CRISPR system precrRNA processing endoribonuclease RAMP protein Cas6 [Bacillus cereus]HDR8229404.1 